MSARVIQVIETEERRGLGVQGDPVRLVRQYYDFDGRLLWEEPDEWAKVPAPPPSGGTISYPMTVATCDHEWGGFNDSEGMRCLKCGQRPLNINPAFVSGGGQG